MAGNRVQYIIDLVVQDKQLRQQMSKVDWEKIIGSKGKGMSDAFAKGTAEATKQIQNAFYGLNIDWSKILGAKDLGRLEQQMAKVFSGSKNQIKAFASMNDISGIQKTVEYVSALGEELKGLGSSFDADQLARGMTSFMKVLMPLSAKIDALAKEPKKIEDAFDRLFNGNISNGAVKISQGFTVVGDAAGKAAIKTNQAIQQIEKGLSSIDALFNKEYNIKFNSDLEEQFYSIDEQIEKVEEDISKLEDKFSKMTSSSKGFDATRSQLVQKYVKQSELYRQLDLIDKKYTSKYSKDDSLLSLNNIIPEDIINKARERIELFLNDARLSLEDISKSTKTTKDGINIPIKLPTQGDLIKTINKYVAGINRSKAIHPIKIKLADTVNVIEDKSKRVYKDNPADDDVNTTKIVQQTEGRFERIATAIEEKQSKILSNTQTWRKNMLKEFAFKSGDFEFNFNDNLIESLQLLFDDYELKVNVDPQYLTDKIKTVLDGSGVTIGGGTANIDANSLASAMAIAFRSVLTGEIPQFTMSGEGSNVGENAQQQREHTANETEKIGRHLDLAEDYVKDVVERLKAVAKYASRESKGSIATRNRFDVLGLDLSKVKNAADVGNDAEIVSMIEKSFLKRDDFGNLSGSTIIDELSYFKGSSSKTILAFLKSMEEVFFMLQENTQTSEEWVRKRDNREILNSAKGKAKAAYGLRGIRSSIRQGDIPTLESIQSEIDLMSNIGQNTDDLQILKSAREALADKTDDASIEEFKNAADTFYKSSTKTFWDLKKQSEDTFKGTVYLQGKNGKTYGKNIDNYKQLANIKDDSVIVDIEVSSTLSDVALGTTKHKYKNRISEAEEKRLMRGAANPDFVVPRKYEEDILNKELTYDGFKPQGTRKINYKPDKILEGITKREEDVEILRQEIEEIDKILNDKNSKIDNSERSKLTSTRNEKETQLQSSLSLIKANKKRWVRIKEEEDYNKLLEKSLMLQGSIKKMEEDGATNKALNKKKNELKKINTQLTEAEAKIKAMGGFLSQEGVREYSAGERKIYALEQLKLIEDDLITARAQKRVSESRISKKDREIADLDNWGLSAGIGASELGKTKRRLTSDFMNSDYVQSQINALRDKVKTAIAEAEDKSRDIFNKKVTTAMEHLNWNPLDQTQVQKFLNTKHGQQLSNDFTSEVDTNTTNLWKQFDEYRKDLLSRLKKEFESSFTTDKGVLSYTSKVQDETGNWIDEIVSIRVKEELRARLKEEKRILETKHTPIQGNIDRLETEKATAIEYGGVSEAELLSGKIIEDQIAKEETLAEFQEQQKEAKQKLEDLDKKKVKHSDESYKTAKKELDEATKQVAYYDMLAKNRQKLVQMRYDESKESTYTDEEKELYFTNQIVSYNEKIENSLAKQKTLKEQIASATGDERAKLERKLSIEEEKVDQWSTKIPVYENKLNRLQTSKSQNVMSGILPNGGIVGNILSSVREAIGGVGEGVQIDTEDLAKEATLRAILQVLGGAPLTADDGYGLGRRKNKESENDAKTLYKTWNVKPNDLDFDTVKTKAIALKQVIDTLYDEGKSDTEEFINAQTELSKLLSAWRNNISKTTNPEFYGKNGKNNWMSYLTSGNTKFFDNLDNVELSSISQKDYLSRIENIGVDTSNTKTEIKKSKENLQIKDFDDFKLQVKSLKQAVELQESGSEEQKKLQTALVQVLQAWARNEASGFGGKLPNAKDWESYLISSGVFDSVDTSITPLTSRQLNKGSKTKNTTSKKTVEQRTDKPKKTEPKAETVQPETRQATGGLLQLVSQLATENTLLQVLSALQSIGTVKGGLSAPTAAGDLYNQLKALLFGSSIDDHERLAYMDSKNGILSGNVIGNIANVSEELINALRVKYPNAKGFDTQIHTHGKSNNPYFSDEDYQHFTNDYESGIKKQVLLTKDHISVLDLTAVDSAKQVKNLMDELIKAGDNAESIKKVFETSNSGAIFETAKFDSLNANSLMKMLGTSSEGNVGNIDAFISKLQTARESIKEAINVGYLSDNDSNLVAFDKILNRTNEIYESIKNGTTSYEEQKFELDELSSAATRYSDIISSAISKNKRSYVGVSEVDSVNKQKNRIISMLPSEDEFNNSNIKLIQTYNEEVEKLNEKYKSLVSNKEILNEASRKELNQQSLRTQAIGKYLISSMSEAERLKQWVDQTGTYKGLDGSINPLGGFKGNLTPEEVKNLDLTMRSYVQDTLKQANIENVKFNNTKQQLIYTFRTSKDTVADMVVQYNEATNALYAYNKQERESLTGAKALIQGFKSKLKSITQYMFSITSITRVFSQLRQGITYIKEIDSALTELKKVTDETEETYEKFLDTASKTASKVGSTIKDVVSSTADWARLNKLGLLYGDM